MDCFQEVEKSLSGYSSNLLTLQVLKGIWLQDLQTDHWENLHPAFDVPEVFRHLGQDHSGSNRNGWADGGVDVGISNKNGI